MEKFGKKKKIQEKLLERFGITNCFSNRKDCLAAAETVFQCGPDEDGWFGPVFRHSSVTNSTRCYFYEMRRGPYGGEIFVLVHNENWSFYLL